MGLDGKPLPASLQLRALKVTPSTLHRYQCSIRDFETWAAGKKLAVNKGNLDQRVNQYLTHLFMHGAETSAGTYLVFGLQLLRCEGDKKAFLPISKESLTGWRKQRPGSMRLPAPEEIVFDFAYAALEEDRADIAMALLLQYDCYLRPSECLGLTKDHLAAPVGGRYRHWAIIIAPFELQQASKTGSYDDSILVADKPDRAWLSSALTMFCKMSEHELFPNLNLSAYERWFHVTGRNLSYKSSVVMPHVLRHSGASNDVFQRRRDLRAVQKHGRWKARSSVSRYEKAGLLVKRWSEASASRRQTIRERAQSLPEILLQRLRFQQAKA